MMVGDFNDYQGTLIGKSLNVFGKQISMQSNPPKSCCEDSGYAFVGDYIFDSKITDDKYYGLPLDYNRYEPIMSDHDPVILIDYTGI